LTSCGFLNGLVLLFICIKKIPKAIKTGNQRYKYLIIFWILASFILDDLAKLWDENNHGTD